MVNDLNDSAYQQIAQDLVIESLSSQGFARLRVISDSMVPLMDIDDIVLVEHAPLRGYRRGDIVVIFRTGEFITHRLVRLRKDQWYTKGDRFHFLDEPITPDEVVGKVIAIEQLDSQIDLNRRSWKIINRYKGWFANLEVEFYKVAKWVHRKIFHNNIIGGVK